MVEVCVCVCHSVMRDVAFSNSTQRRHQIYSIILSSLLLVVNKMQWLFHCDFISVSMEANVLEIRTHTLTHTRSNTQKRYDFDFILSKSHKDKSKYIYF